MQKSFDASALAGCPSPCPGPKPGPKPDFWLSHCAFQIISYRSSNPQPALSSAKDLVTGHLTVSCLSYSDWGPNSSHRKHSGWGMRDCLFSKESQPVHLKEISPKYSLEELMLKLKLQYFGHLVQRTDSWKDPDAGNDWRWEKKGATEDEIVGWHHLLNGYEFEQAPGVGDGQGSLAYCSPRSHRESDTTERLNWIECN